MRRGGKGGDTRFFLFLISWGVCCFAFLFSGPWPHFCCTVLNPWPLCARARTGPARAPPPPPTSHSPPHRRSTKKAMRHCTPPPARVIGPCRPLARRVVLTLRRAAPDSGTNAGSVATSEEVRVFCGGGLGDAPATTSAERHARIGESRSRASMRGGRERRGGRGGTEPASNARPPDRRGPTSPPNHRPPPPLSPSHPHHA